MKECFSSFSLLLPQFLFVFPLFFYSLTPPFSLAYCILDPAFFLEAIPQRILELVSFVTRKNPKRPDSRVTYIDFPIIPFPSNHHSAFYVLCNLHFEIGYSQRPAHHQITSPHVLKTARTLALRVSSNVELAG
jgi:hypothetical protein